MQCNSRSPATSAINQSQSFDIALDDEDFLLPKLLLESPFEIRQKPSCFLLVGRNHAIDDNFIAIGDPSHSPEAFVGLWNEGEAAELIEELLLQVLKLPRFNRPAVIVIEGDKEVIFFHQSRLSQGVNRWTHGSTR